MRLSLQNEPGAFDQFTPRRSSRGLRLCAEDPGSGVAEALKKAGAIDGLFKRFDEVLRASGFLAMSGQIVDATIVATPTQRNTIEEKKAIKAGRIPDTWEQNPARLVHNDRDARWTVKHTNAKPQVKKTDHSRLSTSLSLRSATRTILLWTAPTG